MENMENMVNYSEALKSYYRMKYYYYKCEKNM